MARETGPAACGLRRAPSREARDAVERARAHRGAGIRVGRLDRHAVVHPEKAQSPGARSPRCRGGSRRRAAPACAPPRTASRSAAAARRSARARSTAASRDARSARDVLAFAPAAFERDRVLEVLLRLDVAREELEVQRAQEVDGLAQDRDDARPRRNLRDPRGSGVRAQVLRRGLARPLLRPRARTAAGSPRACAGAPSPPARGAAVACDPRRRRSAAP